MLRMPVWRMVLMMTMRPQLLALELAMRIGCVLPYSGE